MQYLLLIYDEEKRQAILTNWSVATKSTLDNPDDWGVAIVLTYPNWAALCSRSGVAITNDISTLSSGTSRMTGGHPLSSTRPTRSRARACAKPPESLAAGYRAETYPAVTTTDTSLISRWP